MNHMKPEFFLSTITQFIISGLKTKVKLLPDSPAAHWKQDDYTDTSKTSLELLPAPAGKLPGEKSSRWFVQEDAPCPLSIILNTMYIQEDRVTQEN